MKSKREDIINYIIDDMVCFDVEELLKLAQERMRQKLSDMSIEDLAAYLVNLNTLPANERVL
jgi:cytochrome c553